MNQSAVGLLAYLGVAGLCAAWLVWAVRRGRPLDPASVQAYQAFTTTRYFSGLDALRAISVIGVIWTHVTGPHDIHLLNQGNRGVDLFFAISGFLVTTLLLREYARTGRISLRDFYIRRTLRIFPLYYAVLALYCVLVAWTLGGTPRGAEFWDNLPAFLTYTSNWFVGLSDGGDHNAIFAFAWSLATEEQFYLFWPALMVFILWKLRRAWLLVAAALGLLALQLVAAPMAGQTMVATVVASLAPAILLGAALAVLLNNRAIFGVLYPVLGHRWMAPATLVLLLALLQLKAPWLLTRLVMALLVASVCIREDTVLHPLLRWKPAVFVGTISYGIYLMHMLAANVVRQVLGHAGGFDVFVGTTLLVILAAHLSYRYFEAPLLALKGRFCAPRQDGLAPDGRTAPLVQAARV